MIGAIAGDVVGSVYEFAPHKSIEFPLLQPGCDFTDDTVLTVATAHAILTGRTYGDCYLDFGRRYPGRGYGGSFLKWLRSENPKPYGSYGNGSAMRVSPVGFAFDTAERVLEEAERSAAPTHDRPEGIKGAQAVALAVFRARHGVPKAEIRREIEERFGYDLGRSVAAIRPTYRFDETCPGSVPEALIAFLEAESAEHAIRLAVSLGGDADTQAAIAGPIAQAFHRDLPPELVSGVRAVLPAEFLEIIDEFEARFSVAVEPCHARGRTPCRSE
ncbi:MAG TPA: ADP-ribosylglycohydrolase family protein [Thermoanaerobaculia bacterium]|nr:ADP-ribosylglycohydrolase family protein [Thermoanaerobaculia bacterium]